MKIEIDEPFLTIIKGILSVIVAAISMKILQFIDNY